MRAQRFTYLLWQFRRYMMAMVLRGNTSQTLPGVSCFKFRLFGHINITLLMAIRWRHNLWAMCGQRLRLFHGPCAKLVCGAEQISIQSRAIGLFLRGSWMSVVCFNCAYMHTRMHLCVLLSSFCKITIFSFYSSGSHLCCVSIEQFDLNGVGTYKPFRFLNASNHFTVNTFIWWCMLVFFIWQINKLINEMKYGCLNAGLQCCIIRVFVYLCWDTFNVNL